MQFVPALWFVEYFYADEQFGIEIFFIVMCYLLCQWLLKKDLRKLHYGIYYVALVRFVNYFLICLYVSRTVGSYKNDFTFHLLVYPQFI